jgi:ubiquinone/menaquinone biosynthesis C-methylase UbiE
MAESQFRFDDGAAYERMMGAWSRLAGEVFLDWLAPSKGLRWLDVGCGNGAFTELIIQWCAPAVVEGIDPSEGQLAFARSRSLVRSAEFRQGNAMALPFSDHEFDVAVMALVIFFVPDPGKGVSEMVRTVRPGGMVATYAWDMFGAGGFPLEAIQQEMRAVGVTPAFPPSAAASRMDALRELWTVGGLSQLETREITVQRTFPNFDEFWDISMAGSSVGKTVAEMPPHDAALLKQRVQRRLSMDTAGRVTCSARANAIKGIVPA